MAKEKKSDADKLKKGDKEKKGKKKDKAVKEVAPKAEKKAAPAPKPAKKAAPKAKSAPVPAPVISISNEDIALRAYYIAERRQAMGWPGDEHSDWVEAERQLKAEAARKSRS